MPSAMTQPMRYPPQPPSVAGAGAVAAGAAAYPLPYAPVTPQPQQGIMYGDAAAAQQAAFYQSAAAAAAAGYGVQQQGATAGEWTPQQQQQLYQAAAQQQQHQQQQQQQLMMSGGAAAPSVVTPYDWSTAYAYPPKEMDAAGAAAAAAVSEQQQQLQQQYGDYYAYANQEAYKAQAASMQQPGVFMATPQPPTVYAPASSLEMQAYQQAQAQAYAAAQSQQISPLAVNAAAYYPSVTGYAGEYMPMATMASHPQIPLQQQQFPASAPTTPLSAASGAPAWAMNAPQLLSPSRAALKGFGSTGHGAGERERGAREADAREARGSKREALTHVQCSCGFDLHCLTLLEPGPRERRERHAEGSVDKGD